MHKKRSLSIPTFLLKFVVALVLLLTASSRPAQAGQKASPPLEPGAPAAFSRHSSAGGDILVSTPAYIHPASAAVAYNPDDDQFMIAAATNRGVLAQIYASNGVPVGGGIVINFHSSVENPALAYSTVLHEYLLIWTYFSGTSAYRHIYAQRISSLGALLDNPSTAADESLLGVNFPVSTMPFDKNHLSIAYSPLFDEYLVVWWQSDEIYGQRVDGDGFLLDNPGTPLDEEDPAVSFAISTAAGVQDEPQVVYNPDDDHYLVVWQDRRDDNHFGIFAQRLDAEGGLLDNPGTPEVETSPTVNFLIHRLAAFDALDPDLAYNTHLHQYLVAWMGESSTDTIIAGDRISRQGAPLDDPNTSGDESLTNLAISLVVLQGFSLSPALAYNPDRMEYLVAFTYSELEGDTANRRIMASRLYGSGRAKEPYDFPVSTSLAAEAPALAYGSATGQYMVAWPHFDAASMQSDRILAQRLWWPSLLRGHEFNALPAADDQTMPAVAYNSRDHETLVVWEDWRSGDADIYAQRYDHNGLPIGENFEISTHSDDDVNPSVAYSELENRYLVAWEGKDQDSLRHRRVTTQGSLPEPVRNYPSLTGSLFLDPDVVHVSNPADNSFWIAFTEVGSSSRIAARRVFPDNTTRDFVLTDYNAAQSPDLVYNPTDNHVFLAYSANVSSTDQDIWQRILLPDGTLVDSDFVSIAPDGQIHPSATWNEADDEYLVAWTDYRDSGTQGADIYAARVDSDGTRLGLNFKVSKATGLSHQQYPDLVFAADLDPARYRIVWQDDRDGGSYDIRGNWISTLGEVMHLADDPVFVYPGWQLYPALVYVPSLQQAIVAWQDGRSQTEYDVHLTFGAVDVTPPTARFTRDPIFGRAGDTFTLNAWPSRDETSPRGDLLVRWDLTSDGSWDIPLGHDKYITQTVMIPGTYTVTLQVWDRAFNISQIRQKIFVLPPAPSAQASDPLANPAADSPQVSQPPTATFEIETPTVLLAGSTFEFDARDSSGAGALQGHWDWENDGLFDTELSSVLTATHVYTESGDHAVRFEVLDQSTGLSDAALRTLKVLPGPVVSLQVLPEEAVLVPGESLQWRYQALDVYANPIFGPPLTWSLLNPLAGQISSMGLFTAGPYFGQYGGVIRLDKGGLNDTADVLIYPPYSIYLPTVRR